MVSPLTPLTLGLIQQAVREGVLTTAEAAALQAGVVVLSVREKRERHGSLDAIMSILGLH